MNYYPHHIGDYRAATAHLSNEEDLAYRRLLEMYYDTERPIPLDTQRVSRRLRVATESLMVALQDFFTLTETGYVNERCELEIAEYNRKADTARKNGAKGGRRKSLNVNKNNPMGSQPVPSANPALTQDLANHEPVTINQEPSSVPKGTGAEAPLVKSPADMDRDELWSVAKSLLSEQGMPAKQCGSFVGKLVKDYTAEVVVEVVRAAVVTRPVNVQEFLVGGCRTHRVGRPQRQSAMSGLLPPNSPRIPTPEEAPEAWMRDLEPVHV